MQAAVVEKTWVLAEFAAPEALTSAAQAMRAKGYADLDTHSPYPLPGLDEALGLRRSFVPVVAACGALLGLAVGVGLQWFSNVFDFPINVGARPIAGWPSAVPITFESTVLGTAFAIFFGLLAMSKLPQPYHPAFEAEEFRSQSTHGFWISIAAPNRQPDEVVKLLQGLGAKLVKVVKEDQE